MNIRHCIHLVDSNMIGMSRSVVPVTGNSKGAPIKKEEIE